MKQTQYLTTVIRSANRLEIEVPDLLVGQTVEVIVIIPDNLEGKSPNTDRQAFLQLPLAERRRRLEQQAEIALPQYQQNPEWQEWVEFDINSTYD